MWKSLAIFFSLVSLLFPVATLAQDVGASVAQQGNGRGATACLACHGVDGAGNDSAGFPRLAALDAGYLAKQLHDFQSGARQNAVMAPIAKALNDEEIKAVAGYYASLPAPKVAAPKASPEVLTAGGHLVSVGRWDDTIPACVQCHGPGARGVGSHFPGLAGQHAGYIESQIKAWKSGQRGNDPNDLMKAVADRLSDEDITAVAIYLASQPAAK